MGPSMAPHAHPLCEFMGEGPLNVAVQPHQLLRLREKPASRTAPSYPRSLSSWKRGAGIHSGRVFTSSTLNSYPVPPTLDAPARMCYSPPMATTDALRVLCGWTVPEPASATSHRCLANDSRTSHRCLVGVSRTSHKRLAYSRRPAMKSPQMITNETHLEKNFRRAGARPCSLAVSGSLTGGAAV